MEFAFQDVDGKIIRNFPDGFMIGDVPIYKLLHENRAPGVDGIGDNCL